MIYLRGDLLDGPIDTLRSVVFEEIGHHLDVLLNGTADTAGDEGERFSALVRGESPSAAETARMLTEDDHGALVVDGATVDVEFNTVGNAATAVGYTENGAPVSLEPAITLVRNSVKAGQDTTTQITLTIPSATTSDRIRVVGATANNAGSVRSPLADGIAVPLADIGATTFYVADGLGTDKFTYAVTAQGVYTFAGSFGAANSAPFFQNLMQRIQFDSTSENPDVSSRGFTWSIASNATAGGAPLTPVTVVEAVQIDAINDAPTLVAGKPSNGLVEAGNGLAGVQNAMVALVRGDVDGVVTYDKTALIAAGWSTADSGATYVNVGMYGTATLDAATNIVRYLLDDARPATQALAAGASVVESFVVGVCDDGVPAPVLRASVTVAFTITGSNDVPTLAVGSVSNRLVEAGVDGAGTSSATVELTKADVDGTVTYDGAWLVANGWSSADAGVTYRKGGVYGNATLTVATGVMVYVLDNMLPATQALRAGQLTSDTVAVRVIDDVGAVSTMNVSFTIVGTNDAPIHIGATTALRPFFRDTAATVPASELLAGYADPENGPLTLTIGACASNGGAISHTVVDNHDGTYTITPAAGFVGEATLSCDVIDDSGA
jgi:VCBS repeat-containing protein